MATFDFSDEWRLAAEPDRVWALLGRADTWPQWWPSVVAVTERVPPAADGSGGVLRFTFRTRLRYDMSFDATVRREDAARRVSVAVAGRVHGRGDCEVRAVPGGSAVTFRWVVVPVPRWMRVLSRPAGRVFAWNHGSLMAEGARGLAGRLGADLLAEPTSTVALTHRRVAAMPDPGPTRGDAREDVDHLAFQRLPGRPVALTTRRLAAGTDDTLQPDAMEVERFLPTQGRRMVGAVCFVDRFGPQDVAGTPGARIAPHPHTGLQTVTWLLAGEMLHRDSVGSQQLARPQQLNLMTAGQGISHSEESPADHGDVLHGVQLWVALPEASLDVPPAFEHHRELPVLSVPGAQATVVLGTLGGTTSAATVHTPLVVSDVSVTDAALLPLRPDWEHAVLLLDGDATAEGRPLQRSELVYLGTGRDTLALQARSAAPGARLLLLGGQPFGEEILMWWNFVLRRHSEVQEARAQWEAGAPRFGEVVGFDGGPLPAPQLPGLVLRARGRR